MATHIPKPTSTMRKAPSQARSRARIEAMLDAAAHILGERGWAGITTNAVSEVAGVSIGSVYQYFPNKLALIEAVRQRHYDEVLTVLRAATDEATPRTRRIAAFVDGMIAVHSRTPTAHRVLMEEVPQDDETPPEGDAFKRNYQSGCEEFFNVNARYAQMDSSKLRAQVLAAAVAGIVHDAAHQGTLASPAMRQELLALVEACLSRR